MAKLLFEIVKECGYLEADLEEKMDKALLINADNVSEYYYVENDREYWSLKDHFPNIAPPFPNMFIEFKLPEKIVSKEFGVVEMPFGGRARRGMLITSHHVKSDPRLSKWLDIAPNLGWLCTGYHFSSVDGKLEESVIYPYFGVWTWGVDDKGVIIHNGEAVMCGVDYPDFKFLPLELKDLIEQESGQYNRPTLEVCLLAVSFLHCKNVDLVERHPVKKKRNRHGVNSQVSHHVLKIHPMRRVTRADGESDGESSGNVSMHIRRGHFKDYSNGSGLFGKYKGLYWWDASVVGSPENGTTNKSYEIDPK